MIYEANMWYLDWIVFMNVQCLLFNMLQNSLGTEESYLRQLEIEEMYGVKKDDDKKSKEK